MTIVDGIVLKERTVGEHDKFVDILTRNSGVVEAVVRGVKKINSKTASSSQLFAYSRFCLQSRGKYIYINSAEPVHIFYKLRNSLSKVSLACYFSDVVRYCVQENTDSGSVLRLLLNTLYFLENDRRGEAMLKSIFEVRFMAETGFMPDILACHRCGRFEPEELFIGTSDGVFYCKDCFSGESENFMKVNAGVLSALRHIVFSEFEKLYSFRVSERTQKSLSDFSERYILSRTERSFRTLDFYRSLITSKGNLI